MFGGQIFYRRSRFHDLQEAGGVGDFTGRVLGSAAKLTTDWLSELMLQPVEGKNLAVGWLQSPSGKSGKLIGILETERLKHTHILGSTGTGKTTQLANLIVQDICYGNGIGVLDVQGDLTTTILSHIPPERFDDVIILDATDRETPLGFNILDAVPEQERSRTTSEVVEIFHKTTGADSWGPRLAHIARGSILTLLAAGEGTLLDLRRLLLDKEYRHYILAKVHDPLILDFWSQEFEPLSHAQQFQTVLPILNKIGPWITYPESRYIIGQKTSSFNMRQVIDEGKILLIKIPQGILGEDITSLLGALIVSKIQMAVLSRADIPKHQRRPFYLYVDEFQLFVTDSFKKMLTEARAFGLGLIVANQHSEQLSPDLMLALEKNVVARLTCINSEGRHLIRFEEMHEYDRPAYTVKPLPPVGLGSVEQIEFLYKASRVRYGRSKHLIETQIKAQFAQSRPQQAAKSPKAKSDFNFAYEE